MGTILNSTTNIESDNSITLSMRDIIMKDLLTDTEIKKTCSNGISNNELNKTNIYVDQYEGICNVSYNFSINGEPASRVCNNYQMILLPGRNNDKGSEPNYYVGAVESAEPDTIVSFSIPLDASSYYLFSTHKDGVSSSNFLIYGVINEETESSPAQRILLCRGTIYKTDYLFDLTESIIDK